MGAPVRSRSLALIGDSTNTGRGGTEFGAVRAAVVVIDRAGERARDAVRNVAVEVTKRTEGVSTTSAVG